MDNTELNSELQRYKRSNERVLNSNKNNINFVSRKKITLLRIF